MQPLRLYLSLSFVFFVALHVIGHHGLQWGDRTEVQLRACETASADCGPMERTLGDFGRRLASADPSLTQFRLDKYSPYALLLMQPAFAGLLMLLLLGRQLKYAEHFVFSLHLHAFWFVAYLVSLAASWLPYVIFPLMALYGLLALRTVYGVSWWGAVWRSLMLGIIYPILLGLGAAALVVVTLMTGSH